MTTKNRDALSMAVQSEVISQRPWPSTDTPKLVPAPEFCIVEAQAMSTIIVDAESADTVRLVLVAASEGHYTAGTKVPCAIPIGATIIPRQNPECYKIHRLWMPKGDDRDLRMLHLRDVMLVIEPVVN